MAIDECVIDECVIDAELIKRFSNTNNSCSIVNVTEHLLKNQECDPSIKDECRSLIEFFEDVYDKKCIVYYNDSIKKKYIVYLKKMPVELLLFIDLILSNSDHGTERYGSLNNAQFNELSTTKLKNKIDYIDVAKGLNNRTIISTIEDIHNIYKPNSDILLNLNISAKNICSLKSQIDNIRQSKSLK